MELAAALLLPWPHPATWRAHAVDLARFAPWCELEELDPLPAEAGTVADPLTAHVETLPVATLRRRLAAISVAHGIVGVPSPTDGEHVALVRRGLRRVHGPGRGPRRVDALETRGPAAPVAPVARCRTP